MIIVTTEHNSGPGSLRNAINEANTSIAKFVVITFAPHIRKIHLTSNLPDIQVNLKIINELKPILIDVSTYPNSSHFLINTPGILLYLEGLKLIGASNISIFITVDNSPLFLDDMIICYNAYNGAIATAGDITIKNSDISNNNSQTSVFGSNIIVNRNATVEHSRMFNNSGSSEGGSMLVVGDLFIEHSQICNNTSIALGGGVFVVGNFIAHNSLFCNNTVVEEGGAIFVIGNSTIKNSQIFNNTGGFGGGVFVAADSVIEDSNISNNSAQIGGALIVGGNSTIKKSHICDNSSQDNAGAIYIQGKSIIEDSDISNNSAQVDGIVYSLGDSVIKNSRITCNSSQGNGVIFVNNTSSDQVFLTVECSEICNNSTAGFGGGIATTESPGSVYVVIKNSQICKNTANTGGGIYSSGSLTIENSSINENSADTFGGINSNGNVVIKKSHVDCNTATVWVGGIGGFANITMICSTVDNNRAIGMIGGVYLASGNLTMNACSVSRNTTSIFASNVYPMCGGIMIIDGSLLAVDSHIDCNRSLWMPAMLVGDGTITLIDTTVNDNISIGSTGQFGCSAMTNILGGINIFGGSVKRNKTDGYFGSVVAFSSIDIVDAVISENIGFGPSGVVQLLDDSIIIKKSKIIGNEGSAFGSAVETFSSLSPITIMDSCVTGNKIDSKLTIAQMIANYQQVLIGSPNGLVTQLANNLTSLHMQTSNLYSILNNIVTLVTNKILPVLPLAEPLTYATSGVIGALTCQISIICSNISDNTAQDRYGNTTYGSVFSLTGQIAVEKSKLCDNKLDDGGSAIYTQGSATVNNSTVDKNKTEIGSGTIYIDDGGQLVILKTDVKYNRVHHHGGGIYNHGVLDVIDCRIIGNVAHSGGGIYSTVNPISVIDSLIYGNVPDQIKYD